MGVVLQVEGGGQRPGQITGAPRLRFVSAGPEADLFQQGNSVPVVLSARPFAQQPAAQITITWQRLPVQRCTESRSRNPKASRPRAGSPSSALPEAGRSLKCLDKQARS